VAERFDCIVDFAKIAARFGNPSRIRLEDRLVQNDGRGPAKNVGEPGGVVSAGRATSCWSSG
jgi:hypothetical protein